jgi:hypothetical protein
MSRVVLAGTDDPRLNFLFNLILFLAHPRIQFESIEGQSYILNRTWNGLMTDGSELKCEISLGYQTAWELSSCIINTTRPHAWLGRMCLVELGRQGSTAHCVYALHLYISAAQFERKWTGSLEETMSVPCIDNNNASYYCISKHSGKLVSAIRGLLLCYH